MPETITPNTRLTWGCRGKYGSHGKRLRDCSDKLLRWLAKDMRDSDLAAWSVAAEAVLAGRARGDRECAAEQSLEEQADAILRNAGCGGLVPKRRRVSAR